MVESIDLARLASKSRRDEAGSSSEGEGFMSYRGRRHGEARVYREAVSTQHDETGPSMRLMPAVPANGDDDLHPEAWAGRSYSNDGGRGMSRKARIVLAAGFLTLCYTFYLIRRSSYSEESRTLAFAQPVPIIQPSPAPVAPVPQLPLPEWLHREPVGLQPQGKLEAVRDISMHAPLLQGDCLEAWVARGEICSGLTWAEGLSSDPAMEEARRLGRSHDVVFTAVNGSDPRHTAARILYAHRPKGSWADWRSEPKERQEGRLLRRASLLALASRDSVALGDVVNRYR